MAEIGNNNDQKAIQLESNPDHKWTKSSELDFLIASRLIKDSRDLENLIFGKTSSKLKAYESYLNPIVVSFVNIVIIIHLLLPLIEEPSFFQVDYKIPSFIELFCLLVYVFRWLQSLNFQIRSSFFKDKKNYISLITILAIYIDLSIYIILKGTGNNSIRFTRFLRVLLYVNMYEGKELRRAMRNVRKTIPDIINVFALFFVSLLIFSFVGWQLFRRKRDFNGKQLTYANGQDLYFQNFEDSLWDLYVAVTTANFPDVMMPAYNLNGAYVIFFLVFMLVNLYIFINIILATIYTNYKKHLKEEVRETIKLKRDKMEDAFNMVRIPIRLLDSEEKANINMDNEVIRSEHQCVITKGTFSRLMNLVNPKIKSHQINALFRILDFDNNGILSFKEFVHVADLLNIKMSEGQDRKTLFEIYIPRIYNGKWSTFIKKLVRHKIFQMFFDLMILFNIIFVIIDPNSGVEWFFLAGFMVEIMLKIYTDGIVEFIKKYWNIFDTIVILGGLIAGIVDALIPKSEDVKGGATEFFEIVLILRSLRLLKFVASINRFRTIITTIAMITPSLLTYAKLLMFIFYVFSMIGMEIFSKKINNDDIKDINCGSSNLNGTDFAKLNYCKNNFSSFLNSLVLLFELMVVNQWHILSKGFEKALNSKWTRLYFFSFHISCVIVSLNIFTAFIIEAFLLEYETEGDSDKSSSSKLEKRIIEQGLAFEDTEKNINTNEDKKISTMIKEFFKSIREIGIYSCSANQNNAKNELKFHTNSRDAKPVEILLQRMFYNEINISKDDLN
ncbi:two pore calcium channel 1-like [Brachionus plicatilis]|uniref:Two pore calcium channel 1-like n=1 Tax=Brachionus plicatilis TaxID=10195 RepID=A0A3M7QTU5_BRAPC|nr:two pore calcium channel 1-like [Brachionus plicatilis]